MPGKVIGLGRKAKRRAPVEELDAARVSVEAGIEGDKRGTLKKRQVTILAKEDWDAALAELGEGVDLPWTTRRANIFVEGIDLPQQVGAHLRVGSVLFEVTDETDPCQVMEAAHPGLRNALTPDWRGGVLCRVLEAGEIKLGDEIDLAE